MGEVEEQVRFRRQRETWTNRKKTLEQMKLLVVRGVGRAWVAAHGSSAGTVRLQESCRAIGRPQMARSHLTVPPPSSQRLDRRSRIAFQFSRPITQAALIFCGST